MKNIGKRALKTAIEMLCLMLALSMMLCTIPMMAEEAADASDVAAEENAVPTTVKIVCTINCVFFLF